MAKQRKDGGIKHSHSYRFLGNSDIHYTFLNYRMHQKVTKRLSLAMFRESMPIIPSVFGPFFRQDINV